MANPKDKATKKKVDAIVASFSKNTPSKDEEQEPINPVIFSHKELLELDIAPMNWIVNRMIPYPGLIVISGKPGSYKTFFTFWLGMRVSAGLPLFDECDEPYFCKIDGEQPMGKVPTLFIEEENTKQLMKHRAHGMKVFEVGDIYYMIDEGFKFTDERWREAIKETITQKGIKLLILDPFSSVMGLNNENDNAEVSKIMDIVRKEFVNMGLSVILIHHPSKGDGDGLNLRGAGDILGKCDVHLSLEVNDSPDKIIKVRYQKLRVEDISKVSDFNMRLTGDSDFRDLRFRYLGKALKDHEIKRNALADEILETLDPNDEFTQREIAEIVGHKPNNSKFQAAWKLLIKNNQILFNQITKKWHLDLNPDSNDS